MVKATEACLSEVVVRLTLGKQPFASTAVGVTEVVNFVAVTKVESL